MKQKSCIAIVVRHEEKYIQECICYNYILGWDAIIVVVHRDPMDKHPDRTEELINELPKIIMEKVIIKYFEYTPDNYTFKKFQNSAYEEVIYPLVKDKFEWLAMFDCDEYLYDAEKRKIYEILNSVPSNAGRIILSSLTFGHNNQIVSAPPFETRLVWFNKRGLRVNQKIMENIDSINKNDYIFDDNTCLVHYESGAMEDWVNQQYKWNEDKPDYDRFIDLFTSGIKDNRMLIYKNELCALLKHCNSGFISEERFNSLKYNQNTPVLFLIFNKPEITHQVFSKIKQAKPQKLYLANGCKNHEGNAFYEEITNCVDWECNAFTLPIDKNFNYEQIIKSAIGWFFENEPEGIILEDDCLPADSFFGFCSSMLEKYRNDERIGHISGCNVQNNMIRGDGSYYFSSLIDVWGWAGWRRVWKDFDFETENRYLKGKIEQMVQILNHSYIKDYWSNKFQPLLHDKYNFFRLQYSYHQIVNNRLSVIPNSNLITKIGYPEGSTDFNKNHPFAGIPVFEMDEIIHPSLIIADTEADIYSLNREIKILPSKFYGNEFLFLFLKNKLLSIEKKNNNCMKIPKIIHQIYFDDVGLSENLICISETWKENHPDWEYIFWDREKVTQFMESNFQNLIPLFHTFLYDVQRIDFVKYLILYCFGGVYVDMDYESIEPLDSLLWNTSCCFGMEPHIHAIRNNKEYIIGNALIASVTEHDFIDRIIKDISTYDWKKHKYDRTKMTISLGSFILNKVFDAYERKDEITLLPAELVAPLSSEEVESLIIGNETIEIEYKLEKAFAIQYFLDR